MKSLCPNALWISGLMSRMNCSTFSTLLQSSAESS